MIGTDLSHFRIIAKLGEGGMGEVYRAEDSKLGREVAIKVLPREMGADFERMARFEREAQLLASLNHPNIGAIHGFDESGGRHFLVLELVEGETLQEVMERGALPQEASLQLSVQIAEALEAAHERGIVHRDLKPANIKITPEGKVKILDFGLAKAWEAESSPHSDLSISPTLTAGMTQAGVILGTAAYMSPEQARGQAVDKRTDIWAFGVILYEMLSGQSAFRGDTVTDLIAAVVTYEPDRALLPPELPRRIRSLLDRCLKKDARERLRDIGDARIEISEVLESPAEDAPAVEAAQSRRRPTGAIAATAVGAALLGALAAWLLLPSQDERTPPVARLLFQAPARLDISGIPQTPLAISRDGTMIVLALAGELGPELWLRDLDSFELRRLPGAEGGQSPVFSPDGESIAFMKGAEIHRMPLDGGLPVVLTEYPGLLTGMSWADDGWIYYAVNFNSLLRISASGGEPETLTEPGDGPRGISWPRLLPGGEALLVQLTGDQEGRPGPHIGALSLDSGQIMTLTDGSGALYSESGHLVWTRENRLHVAPFDPVGLRFTGPTIALGSMALTPENYGAPALALSDNGTLLYRPAFQMTSDLLWVDRSGRQEVLVNYNANIPMARLSPDESRIAIAPGWNDLRVLHLDRGMAETVMPSISHNVAYLAWMPDGRSVAYGSNQEGPFKIFLRDADGGGTPELLVDTDYATVPTSVSPDGETLLYYRVTPDNGRDIFSLRFGEESQPLVVTAANERGAMFSPDGRFFAYVSNREGQDEVFVRRFPDDGSVWKVSVDGGAEPMWSPSGSELFFRTGDSFMSASVDDRGGELRVGLPRELFDGPFVKDQFGNPGYQVTRDGRFLVIREQGNSLREVYVTVNWFDELRRLAPPS